MKNLKNLSFIVVILSIALLNGCEQTLQPELKGQIRQDQLFTTEQGFLLALNGAYAPLSSGNIYNTSLWAAIEKASDDGWTWRKESEEQNYSYTPTKTEVSNWWEAHYTGINRCNTILSRIGNTEVISGNLKDAIEGQAKFLRALYYYNLVRLYGGVPLIMNEVTSREEAEQPRATIEAVYEQIKTDLSDAITLLPASYTGNANLNVGMATNGAAQVLKAKVHLELEEWSNAASIAEEIIASGEYGLHDDYSSNFYGNAENGIESVFEVQFSSESAGAGANHSNFVAPELFQGPAAILPTDNNNDFGISTTSEEAIIQAFETGDVRKGVAVDTYGLSNFLDPEKPDGSLYYINKYYASDYQPNRSPFNFPLIRYSEVLLMAAEALNEQSAGNANAINYVTLVRDRADLPPLPSSVTDNQQAFREAIRHERRVELSFEGKRYFDLNRWGILKQKIALTGVTISPDKLIAHPITGKPYHLFPLPSTEFINNANLGEQNPGY